MSIVIRAQLEPQRSAVTVEVTTDLEPSMRASEIIITAAARGEPMPENAKLS